MRPITLVALVVVVALAVACGYGAYVYIERISAKPPGIFVVVASQDIEAGQRLNEANVRVVECPEGSPLAADAFYVYDMKRASELAQQHLNVDPGTAEQIAGSKDLAANVVKQLIGQGKVAKTSLVALDELYAKPTKQFFGKDVVITKSGLADAAGLTSQIPVGKRAFTVPVIDHNAVAGFIESGSMVDILFTPNELIAKQKGQVIRLFQSVKVLAVNFEYGAQKGAQAGRPIQSVTVLVDPKQEAILNACKTNGTMSLGLRNPIDDTVEKEIDVALQEIFDVKSTAQSKAANATGTGTGGGAAGPTIPPMATVVQTGGATNQLNEMPPSATPGASVVLPAPKRMRYLVYRDLAGRVQLEIPVDPDGELAKSPSLKGLLEDTATTIKPETTAAPAMPVLPTGSVIPGGPEKPQS